MPAARSKLVVGLTALALAAGYLGFAGMRSGWTYYLEVDAIGTLHPGERARIRGTVTGEPAIDRTAMRAAFDLNGKTRSIKVQYQGAIPELFAVGREVVVEGRLDAAGVLQADTLMTKCASKYVPADTPGASPTSTGTRP